VFEHHVLVTKRKCAENIFITEESTSPFEHEKDGSVTILTEFLDFYLFLYTAYSCQKLRFVMPCYIKSVKSRKYETQYTLPSKAGLPRALMWKLQLQAVLR
jgi:hypothetical protein